MYIALVQLAERPGAQELAQVASTVHQDVVPDALMEATLRAADRSAWTSDEQALADAAAARITEAVLQADGLIDGYLRRRGYAVPLSPVPRLVAEWSRQISRYYLHKDTITDERSSPIARDYRDALRLLQLVADGKLNLGEDDPLASAVERDVRSFGQERVFTADKLGDY